MQITKLKLNNVRIFKDAEIEFHPGMNLIVGINGAGKSTILDALCIVLSNALPQFTVARSEKRSFDDSDITIGEDSLSVGLEFQAHGRPFDCQLRREFGEDDFGLKPSRKDILGSLKEREHQPLAVYFSVYRSLPDITAQRLETAEGQAAAFVDSLSSRELRLQTIGYWWLAQEKLIKETGNLLPRRHLDVLRDAVTLFLDDYSDFHVEREELPPKRDKNGRLVGVPQPAPELLISKGNTKLNVIQLSEGERGMLALVIDLARRLFLANPDLENPLDGKAVVLIDELDLHLHPSWQRTIVDKLTRTFPNCQFIATTHSPQILGEVPPESIILIENGQIHRPYKTFGRDSNWILEFLMGTPTRNITTLQKFEIIDGLIEVEQYEQAQEQIDQLRLEIGEDEELIMLQSDLDWRMLDTEA